MKKLTSNQAENIAIAIPAIALIILLTLVSLMMYCGNKHAVAQSVKDSVTLDTLHSRILATGD